MVMVMWCACVGNIVLVISLIIGGGVVVVIIYSIKDGHLLDMVVVIDFDSCSHCIGASHSLR